MSNVVVSNKRGPKRKLVDNVSTNESIMNEPPAKKQRLMNTSQDSQLPSKNPVNPLIIRFGQSNYKKVIDANKTSQNRTSQKMMIKNMKLLDEIKVRKLLLYVIEHSDEAVELLETKLQSSRDSDLVHCVICHTDYDPKYNGGKSCVLKSDDIDGECGRGECPCGGWDCCNSSCTICDQRFCEGGGDDHCCRVGMHISDPDSRGISRYSLRPCDEECGLESDENEEY